MATWRQIDTDKYQLKMDNLCTLHIHVTTRWLGPGFQAEATVRLNDMPTKRYTHILKSDETHYVDAVQDLQKQTIDYALSVCKNQKAYISRIESELKKHKKKKS